MCHRVSGHRAGLLAAVLSVVTLGPATAEPPADDQAHAIYRQALVRERALRTPTESPPPLRAFREVVDAYRAIVDSFPDSAFADRALWQAAGVALAAFERDDDHHHQALGMALLDRLRAHYPRSPFVERITERRAQFDAVAGPPPTSAGAEATTQVLATHPTAPPSSETMPSLSQQLGLGIARVVLDPGHGGWDPGAVGHELHESAVVLDIARRVAARLGDYGIEAVLTRRRDRFLPLKARAALATRIDADLFLSIHANASPRAATRGIETYVLDFTTSTAAAELAARENRHADATLADLDTMVRRIGRSAKTHESQALAERVQRRLVTKLRQVDPGIPDLGVKTAPFVVLAGTRVPSVLAEVSFLSNAHDARLLGTDSYRDLIADGLVEAVLDYRHVLKPTPSADVSLVD